MDFRLTPPHPTLPVPLNSHNPTHPRPTPTISCPPMRSRLEVAKVESIFADGSHPYAKNNGNQVVPDMEDV